MLGQSLTKRAQNLKNVVQIVRSIAYFICATSSFAFLTWRD